jgi:hypothetical protein
MELLCFFYRYEHEPSSTAVRIVDGFEVLVVWFTVDACLLVLLGDPGS